MRGMSKRRTDLWPRVSTLISFNEPFDFDGDEDRVEDEGTLKQLKEDRFLRGNQAMESLMEYLRNHVIIKK